ncbi:MAG: response regulator [Acidobacteria bacterium]|nr:response regulator [Acidobacteriota bacterium]
MSDITVLAVDDSPLILEMVKDYLGGGRFMVITARNGKEGLDILNQIKPEMIISDIVMPEMDGWAFCEAIRKNPDTTDIPFLFLTGEKDVPTRIRGLKIGADDYLTKPFSREELLERASKIADKVKSVRKDFRRRQAALSGHTSQLAMADLLQLLSLNGKTGVLCIDNGRTGKIYFRSGKIINATLESVSGLKALYRLLAWDEANFELEPLLEDEEEVEEKIHDATQSILMEGFTQIDEACHLKDKLPGEKELLQVALTASKAKDLGDAEKQVLKALGKGATLVSLLDRLSLTDLQIFEAVIALRSRGLIEAHEPVGAVTV